MFEGAIETAQFSIALSVLTRSPTTEICRWHTDGHRWHTDGRTGGWRTGGWHTDRTTGGRKATARPVNKRKKHVNQATQSPHQKKPT